MKKHFTLFFVISSLFCRAQLSVQNDAYIYVNDTFIFVEDDVNLDDVNSTLYLRNEGQLLQGNGVTGNTGNGELSVYQQGTVNKWTYNFWCSPIGQANGSNTNGDFNITQLKQPFSNLVSNDFNFVSSDDGNNLANPIEISNRWIYTYQQSAEYGDWNYVGNINDIIPGLGFTMKGTSGNPVVGQTVDFRGKPNNGLIINGVRDTEFTLVGNPYPSAMDAAAFIHHPLNVTIINGVLYYWEQRTDIESHVLSNYIGGYAEYTIDATGTVETFVPAVFFTYDANGDPLPLPPPGEFGSKTAKRYIPIGQGFMVEGSAPFGFVRTTNDMRVFEKESSGNSYFFRNNNNSEQTNEIVYNEYGLNIVPDDFKRFRLNVDFSVSGNDYTRQLLMNFHDSATTNFDYGLEVKRSENLSTDAYWNQDGIPYSVQALQFNEDLIIPITLQIEEVQPVKIRLFDAQNFVENQPIYVFDTENSSYTNLRQTDFTTTLNTGIYSDRFKIVFKTDGVLSLDDHVFNTVDIFQDNFKSILKIDNPKLFTINSIELFNVLGRSVFSVSKSSAEHSYSFSTANLNNGVYVVKISTNDHGEYSQKIVVNN
ncbi:MAG: T9SS type A sorting domain-containing protein [Winogradskyella sp.]|nr:T9SS type A sorting domain-containing protein [Winogradskyella sp.]